MEELFCIGCGAQIQTEDKEKAEEPNEESATESEAKAE